jgi:histone H3/H4
MNSKKIQINKNCTSKLKKISYDKQKLQQFMITKPALQKILKNSSQKRKIKVSRKMWENINLTR